MTDFKRMEDDALLQAYVLAAAEEDARPSPAVSLAVLAAAAAQAAPLKATPANDAANQPFWSFKRYGGAMAASLAVCSLATLLVLNNPGLKPGEFEPSEASATRAQQAATEAAPAVAAGPVAAPAPVAEPAPATPSAAADQAVAAPIATTSIAKNDNTSSQEVIYLADKSRQAKRSSQGAGSQEGLAAGAAGKTGTTQAPAEAKKSEQASERADLPSRQAPPMTATQLAKPAAARRAESSQDAAPATQAGTREREFDKAQPAADVGTSNQAAPGQAPAPSSAFSSTPAPAPSHQAAPKLAAAPPAPAAPAAPPAVAAAPAMPAPTVTARAYVSPPVPPPAPTMTERSSIASVTPLDATQRLLAAAANGQVTAVQTALAQGANVNARDAAGRSALHVAVLGRHVAVLRALLAAGADRNTQDANGATPLQLAKRANFADIVAELER